MPISTKLGRLESNQGTKWRPFDCGDGGVYKATDWQPTRAAAVIGKGLDRFNKLVPQRKANRTM